MIPYGKQQINQDDIDAVTAVLQSDFLTQGPQVPAFETAICGVTGAPYTVAVNSATSALHIACLALDLGFGDELWTTPNSFVASANCGLYCGARVDFVDIDPRTYNLCPKLLARKLANQPPPKILVVVDFAGEPAALTEIHQLAKQYNFAVIEDASHAIGSWHEYKPVGSGDLADITVFSFHPVKIVTTAEGGVATTARADLAERMRELRSHGITRDTARMSGPADGDWYYQQIDLGFNYRMTELQAALGLSQLTRLPAFIERRQVLAKRYDLLLTELSERTGQSIATQHRSPTNRSALHLYTIELNPACRRAVFDYMRSKEIGVNVHYIPIHTQPYYQELGFSMGDFPVAEGYYAGTMSLPLHAGLSNQEQDFIVQQLEEAIRLCG